MTETVVPQRGGDGEAGMWGGGAGDWWNGVEVAIAIAMKHHTSGSDILNRKPKASNSIEQLLSRVNG